MKTKLIWIIGLFFLVLPSVNADFTTGALAFYNMSTTTNNLNAVVAQTGKFNSTNQDGTMGANCGYIGNGYNFTGTLNRYTTRTLSSNKFSSQQIGISFWWRVVNLDYAAGGNGNIAWGGSVGAGAGMHTLMDGGAFLGRIQSRVTTTAGSKEIYSLTGNINNREWNHIAMNWIRNTTGTQRQTLYINGKLIANQSSTKYNFTNTAAFYIGDYNNNGAILQGIAGCLDEMGFWNRTLTTQEISILNSTQYTYPTFSPDIPIHLNSIRKVFPQNNSVFATKNITLSALINTTTSNTNVSFFINQQKNKTIIIASASNNTNVTFNRLFFNGVYNLSVQIQHWATTANSTVNNFRVNVTSLIVTNRQPANNTQYNKTNINYNATVFNNATKVTGKLFRNGVFYSTQTKGQGTFLFNWSNIVESQGQHTYYMYFNNSDGLTSNHTPFTFYIDTIPPTIVTSFRNNSIYYLKNITASFNITDDFMLFRYNLSIDGVTIKSKIDLNSTFHQINLTYSINSLTNGKHRLGITFADGHTDEDIDEMDVKDGWFNDYLTYELNQKQITIQNKDSSIFDEFSTVRHKDRYSFTYEPATLSDSYTFNIESDSPIHILEKEPYGKWLVTDDRWIDFLIQNEEPRISMKRITDSNVEVTLSNIQNPEKLVFNSIGQLNIVHKNYTFYRINATATAQNLIFEGSLAQYNLYLNMTDILNFNPTARLRWNGVNQGANLKTNVSNVRVSFLDSFVAPLTSAGTKRWTWFFNITGATEQFNITGTQTYSTISITNCTGGYEILNYNVYDEENKTLASSGVNIKTDLTLSSVYNTSQLWNFSINYAANNLTVCLPSGVFNSSNYSIGTTTTYQYDNHELEYHFIQNMTLSSTNIPNRIKLYDLLSKDSTSFIVSYRDENFRAMENRVIDVLRKYVGDGMFRSVEHGLTSPAGQTNAHLVAEDVIYQFIVSHNGAVEYSSPSYKAICQQAPCAINLQKTLSSSFVNLNDLNVDLEFNKTSKTATLTYSTRDGTTKNINITIYKNNGAENESVCSNTLTSSAGVLTCVIP